MSEVTDTLRPPLITLIPLPNALAAESNAEFVI